MKSRLPGLILGLLLAVVATARAEIALLSSGKILYIDRYERRDERVTLFLTGGGEVSVSAELVVNIVPNEILPAQSEGEDEATSVARLPLLPQWGPVIAPSAERHGLEPGLVAAVIMAESSGDPTAVSGKGARGLMQLMPETARRLGVSRVLDPVENVEGGALYLRRLLDLHDQDLGLALAAYNAGPAAVARHGGIPPYGETRRYVARVLELYDRYRAAAGEEDS
ncbi:MAG: lytic transglycosylase domain-containing protein [Acidobacteriota bacterium]